MTEDGLTTVTAEQGGKIVVTRVFDASRELVFKACTDSNLIPQWWGPKEYDTSVDAMDVRPGGVWRYVQRGPDGEFAFKGVYHTVMPPERLVYTFEFEGMPGHVMLETVTFEEQNGKTKMTVADVFQPGSYGVMRARCASSRLRTNVVARRLNDDTDMLAGF